MNPEQNHPFHDPFFGDTFVGLMNLFPPVPQETPGEIDSPKDLSSFIESKKIDFYNVQNIHTSDIFGVSLVPLVSFSEEILITVPFTKKVKIRLIQIQADEKTGPREISLFVNKPNTSFTDLETLTADQELILTNKDLTLQDQKLKYAKFSKSVFTDHLD